MFIHFPQNEKNKQLMFIMFIERAYTKLCASYITYISRPYLAYVKGKPCYHVIFLM